MGTKLNHSIRPNSQTKYSETKNAYLQQCNLNDRPYFHPQDKHKIRVLQKNLVYFENNPGKTNNPYSMNFRILNRFEAWTPSS